jgi:hypothetical protein
VITIHRAAQRFRTEQPGITTWHCFSSGAHYDEQNLSFGPVVACDEHLLDPGAGFERHAHARLELISWVLEGGLGHEDSAGRIRVVVPGRAQYQLAGGGIEHSESNVSRTEPLHFVQLWLMCDEYLPDYDVAQPPLNLAAGTFAVLRGCADEVVPAAPFVYAFVGAGEYLLDGETLRAGDSVRASDDELRVTGSGQLLVTASRL